MGESKSGVRASKAATGTSGNCVKVEAAGELSLALRSIAEGGDEGIKDTKPVLSEAFMNNKKKSADGEHVIVRYGIESVITSR